MTLDEAIAHAREVATEQKRRSGACVINDNECDKFSACIKCAKEHEQLAEWLEELKLLRELKDEHRKIGNIEGFNKGYSKAENDYYAQSEKDRQSSYDCGYWIGYKMAIDDFVNACKEDILCQTFGLHIKGIERIAEQLKEGEQNESV